MDKTVLHLIQILLTDRSSISMDRLQHMLGISEEELLDIFKEVETICEPFEIRLVRQVGEVQLLASQQQRWELKLHLDIDVPTMETFTSYGRRKHIAMRLLMESPNFDVEAMMRKFHQDKEAFEEDFKQLLPLFQKHQLSIASNGESYWVEGSEQNIRNLLFELMKQSDRYLRLNELIGNPNFEPTYLPVFSALDFEDTVFYDVFSTVLSCNLFCLNKLPFEKLQEILVRVFIACIRISFHQNVTSIEMTTTNPEAEIISQALEASFELKFSKEEVVALQQLINAISTPQKLEDFDTSAEAIAKELIQKWENEFHCSLDKDKALYQSLYSHCQGALLRWKQRCPKENEWFSRIQYDFENEYFTTQKCCESLEDEFDYLFNEDEIGFLTLHLVAALERSQEKLKVLFVSDFGVGMTNYIRQKIQTSVPSLDIVKAINFLAYRDEDLDAYDLILTTSNARILTKKIVCVVTPVIDEATIMELSHFAYEFHKRKKREEDLSEYRTISLYLN